MNYAKLSKIIDNYLNVEKHLFKSKKTFKEYLLSIVDDEEMLQDFELTNDEVKQFIEDTNSDELHNVESNTIVKVVNRDTYTLIACALKPTQSYSRYESIAKKKLASVTNLSGQVNFITLGGLIEINNNRTYLIMK